MRLPPLPDNVDDFDGANWDAVAPYFEELRTRPLTAETTETWLGDWSHLEALLSDTYTKLMVAYHLDTASAEKQAAAEQYVTVIYPKALEAEQPLKQKLIESGYDAPQHAVLLRRFRNEFEIYRDENVPLLAELEQLSMQYQKIMGAMTVQFDGKELTVQQLRPYQLRPDRDLRERAWRAGRERQMQDREQLHDLFDQMLKIRHQIALNAGFENYRDYMFRSMGRFDYTPADCKAFHVAIEQVVVPAAQRRMARRRELMGLTQLRPWDTAVDPQGREPLMPFDDVQVLIDKVGNIFRRVDPTLAGYFQTMADERLLELDSRKGKAPGGYCTPLHLRKRAFIYMNAVGVHDDVQTLLHESGHAFHDFEMSHLPLIWEQGVPMEIAEVASMAMELLAAPNLGEFYTDKEVARARIEHLEGTIAFLPYMAVVDAFQHWMYENPTHDRRARDTKWLELMQRFMPGTDWSGLEDELASYWQRQLHIYEVPFYYVEYGIAQVGAWQVWRNSLADSVQALANYRRALALGYTRPLPELYATAGASFAMGDPDLLNALVTLIESQLGELEGRE